MLGPLAKFEIQVMSQATYLNQVFTKTSQQLIVLFKNNSVEHFVCKYSLSFQAPYPGSVHVFDDRLWEF
jgi:hypothetical protein